MKEVKIRPATDNDKNFIFATWLKNYKSSPFAKRVTNKVFFKHHHEIIEFILNKSGTEALIAHDASDSDFIVGYLIVERIHGEQVIHFAFVKSAFQKMGICAQLIKHADIDLDTASFTHWTYPTNDILLKYPNLTYNPYKL